jgi:hypothetical protein
LGPFGAKVASVENADWWEKRRLVRGVAAASEVVVAAVSCEDWSLRITLGCEEVGLSSTETACGAAFSLGGSTGGSCACEVMVVDVE